MSREHWAELPLCFAYSHTYNNYQYRVILGFSNFSLTGTVSTSPVGEVDTVPVSENSFNIAKQYAYCRATRSLFS